MEPILWIYDTYVLTAKPKERLSALDGIIREYDNCDYLECGWRGLYKVEFEWVEYLKRLNIYASYHCWDTTGNYEPLFDTHFEARFHAYMEKSTNGWEYHGPVEHLELMDTISQAATEELERRRL
jgi:hypothetical protein